MRRSQLITLIAVTGVTIGLLVAVLVAQWRPFLGLDLQGGVSVVYQSPEGTEDEAIDQAIEIIRNRVDALGAREPDITRQGDTVVVQIPGIDDPDEALDTVGQTAELLWRPVLAGPIQLSDPEQRAQLQQVYDLTVAAEAAATTTTTVPAGGETTTTVPAPAGGETTTTAPASAVDPTSTSEGESSAGERPLAAGDPRIELVAQTTTTVAATTTAAPTTTTAAGETTTTAPGDTTTTAAGETTTTTAFDPATAPTADELLTPPEDDLPDATVILPDETGELAYLLGPAQLTGVAVDTASADIQTDWFVVVEFTDEGSEAFDEMAAGNYQQSVAIVLDGVVASAPVFQQTEYGGTATITGSFTEQEAKNLALVLRFGALPVRLEPLSTQTVSATLGQNALEAGLISGLIGLLLVSLFMLLYYRLLGVVTILSFAFSGAVLWIVISYLGQKRGLTLTLAGATGIIVSVGIAADSGILYFERIKEQVARGRSVRSAADGSFSSSFSTTVKADSASLIGAGLLYWLTVGPVRGFALFLFISTLIDLFTTYVFTRPLVLLLSRSRFAAKPARLGLVVPETQDESLPSPVEEVRT